MLTAFNCAKKEDNGWWKKGAWSPGAILSFIKRNPNIADKLRDLQMQYHDVIDDGDFLVHAKDGARLKELERLGADFAMLTDEQIKELCSLLDKSGVQFKEEDLHGGQKQREYDFLSDHSFQLARQFVDQCVSDVTFDEIL